MMWKTFTCILECLIFVSLEILTNLFGPDCSASASFDAREKKSIKAVHKSINWAIFPTFPNQSNKTFKEKRKIKSK